MGLDQYLTAKRWISEWNPLENSQRTEITKLLNLPKSLDDCTVQEVVVSIGDWRKANQIHRWFVENIQLGKDDCGTYEVSRDQLTELRGLCNRVLKFRHMATDQLPTATGFFFGTADYDEWYFQDLEHTVDLIDRALEFLALPDQSWTIYYGSSW